MRRYMLFLLTMLTVIAVSCTQKAPEGMVLVKGGITKNTKSNLYGKPITIEDFYIGRYEVTQKEWFQVMGTYPSTFKGDTLPVETVSWYDCIEYCNKRSVMEGLTPYYTIDKDTRDPNNGNERDEVKWTVSINRKANGYRLPVELEWEYAAGGGQKSKSYTYSGSNTIETAAWYWQNSGDEPLTGFWNYQAIQANGNQTHPVGKKAPNELGLFDMSGNVREWCWDWYGEALLPSYGTERVWRGGGWLGADFACESTYRGPYRPDLKGHDTGLRVCRDL